MSRKSRKTLAALSLAFSLALTGCGSNETNVEKISVEESNDLCDNDLKGNKEDLLFDNFDLTEYGLYDDTMIKGIEITKPYTEEKNKYIFKPTHHIVVNMTNVSDDPDIAPELYDTAWGFLDEETIKNGNVVAAFDTYESLDGTATYGEKRTYFKVNINGEEQTLASIEQQFSDLDKNVSIFAETISTSEFSYSLGTYVDSADKLPFEVNTTVINEFKIPMGIYTEDDLLRLTIESSDEKVQKLSN